MSLDLTLMMVHRSICAPVHIKFWGTTMSTVLHADLPDSICGFYDADTNVIHIDKGLSRTSRRSTLAHEQVHAVMGHRPAKSLAENVARETCVEFMTARILITFPALLRALTMFSDMVIAAAYLDVDPSILYARLFGLDRLERVMIDTCARQCIGIMSVVAASAVTGAIPIIALS